MAVSIPLLYERRGVLFDTIPHSFDLPGVSGIPIRIGNGTTLPAWYLSFDVSHGYEVALARVYESLCERFRRIIL